MWRNKAHECKGGQRGFAVIRLLMEQKRKKDLGDLGKRGWIYCPAEKRIYRRWWEGGVEERERNQTGWPTRAHTDALCLMSRWHFCSPSPTLARWRNGQRGKARRRERAREGEDRRRQRSACITQGHEPQTKSGVGVHRRASQSGRGRAWEGSHFAPRPSSSFICLFIFFFIFPPSAVSGTFDCDAPRGSWCTVAFIPLWWFAALLRRYKRVTVCRRREEKKKMSSALRFYAAQFRGYLIVHSLSPWVDSFWIPSLH